MLGDALNVLSTYTTVYSTRHPRLPERTIRHLLPQNARFWAT